MLTFGATAEGANSPFDGFILTARETIPPLRWGGLDPITSPQQSQLILPHKPELLLARMVIFDAFTKDVGPLSTQLQSSVTSLPAHYPGPVAKVVGGPRVFAPLAIVWTSWL
ncbi:hypothetical protein C8J57DRAFT_1548128 [Mycena rebaudengoi]|nr:hypothetical protein C8J57DRAFT_1548128 [Mycena rebaudengoi]